MVTVAERPATVRRSPHPTLPQRGRESPSDGHGSNWALPRFEGHSATETVRQMIREAIGKHYAGRYLTTSPPHPTSRLQSAFPAMTWADSLGNMKALDQWRRSVGLHAQKLHLRHRPLPAGF